MSGLPQEGKRVGIAHRMKGFLRDKRNPLIILLLSLVCIRMPAVGIRFLLWVAAGVSACALSDIAINILFLKRKILPKSAIVSGLIIAGILDYREPLFVLVILSFLAIISKHVLTFRKKHIFNPANFALFFAALFKVPLTWSIESHALLIIIAGLYLAYSLKKIPHILGFLIFFGGPLVAFTINPFIMVSWFFLFVMLIEPKTSGYGIVRGFAFGATTGIGAFLIFKFLPQIDIFVGSLFVANLLNLALSRIGNKREKTGQKNNLT